MRMLISLFSIPLLALGIYGQNEFPSDFKFGTATAAYQIEGAWNLNGKGENIWDRYTHRRPDQILDGSNGDVACDSYHKFREDVQLMKAMGVDFYRFSLSWTRILPKGLAYKINPDGIRYYNQLIDELIANDIEPIVTIFHWDTPQFLEDLGGFTNELMVDWFADYARVVFENFGGRVKWWLTFNEPKQTCLEGYGGDNKAPAYQSTGVGDYLCTHNLLKAHAKVYHMYDEEYRPLQNGKVSITIDGSFYYPKTNTPADQAAAERMIEFMFGWYTDPIYSQNGDYPEVMKTFVAERSRAEGFSESRLPEFTPEEVQYIRGTYDFFGLNHYTSLLAENIPPEPIGIPAHSKDARTIVSFDPSWPSASASWLKVVPGGFKDLLLWIKNRYSHDPNMEIYITENGFTDLGELNDLGRVDYYTKYLTAMLEAMAEGVNVKGYMAWSLLDNFEWKDGYVNRFGLHHVDFSNPDRPRTEKTSAAFLREIFTTKRMPETGTFIKGRRV